MLKADEGLTDEEIAEELEVGRATVERVRRRSVEEGLERALNRKKQGSPSRPPKLDGAGEARLVQLACSAPPEGRKRWTLHLLSHKLVELRIVDSISHSTVHRRLKKKRAQALAGRALLHPPPEQNAAFVHAMEDVLEVYHRPEDPVCPQVCMALHDEGRTDQAPGALSLHPGMTS